MPPLGRDIAHHLIDHDFVGEAAKMAYFFFLSVFPALLIIFSLTGFIGGDVAFARITTLVRTLTPDASAILHRFASELITERRRGWWSWRSLALSIPAIGSVLIVLGTVIVIGGVAALRALGLSAVWDVLRWPLAAALPLFALWLAFYFLPDRARPGGAWEAFVGATIATVPWAIATAMFSVYLASIRDYSQIYGAIGTVMALLIWFFLSAFAVLFGGVVDVALEHRQRELRAHTSIGTDIF